MCSTHLYSHGNLWGASLGEMLYPKAELGEHSFPRGNGRAVLGVWRGTETLAKISRTVFLVDMTVLSHLFNPKYLLLFLQ